MKTTLKPRMNPIEFTITRRINWPCGDLSSSTPAPEINETYPGTNGSTHGERKEISPAKNAASGNGRLDMRLYCTCWLVATRNKTRGDRFSCKKKRDQCSVNSVQ